ncbi:nucleotidyltransferase domain-containing protein [Geoalkalibacter halelectricus]|uniref:Nucleotidyltransferase domain-containing protein n=1 Tax=Geoalkalibacter halelectricus TaxID=2847045 RepID=A0ABY5ZPG2_9BACT|nr:nucleotidyltransferase domain-containing protein [Geoalkalibacter halelectricus]UWZ79775.1 nucleotidyltransferase domain-containing protein [Geoalkalibacter halelectricus]
MSLPDKNRFGLTARDMQTLREIFDQYPEVKTVVVFGSRAKGTFAAGSDIDLAIMDRLKSEDVIRRIKSALDDSTPVDFGGRIGLLRGEMRVIFD